ncbi:pollen-specific leucine-rich repeat extensin-like protein 1 [Sparus aurata]|uniref:pollen-specific leucine-rich repeat extensin-like protein 1 n=1 Tax=Sparus aurata TaxID=8175 RepID=UPI0011C1419C|nr:pollen-specific leucine-rich repeat extensin-like protein 1 [Sparus aurata]
MGGKNSRKTVDEDSTGDKKYMKQWNPQSVKYLDKWQKKYGFTGRLKVREIEDLISRLETSLITKRGKKHEKRADELRIAHGWLTQSKARQNNLKKQKEVKREAEKNQILFMRKEDNETNCKQAPEPSPPPYAPLANAPVEQNIPEPVSEPKPAPAAKPSHLSNRPPLYPKVPSPKTGKSSDRGGPSHTLRPTDLLHLPNRYTPTNSPAGSPSLTVRNQKSKPPEKKSSNMIAEEVFPQIQVANPQAGGEGQPPILYVFRPWTLAEAANAVAGIPPPEDDPEEWIKCMRELIDSYRLNGQEAGEAMH